WSQPYFGANQGMVHDYSPVPRHIVGDLYQQGVQSGDKSNFVNSPFWTTQFVGAGPYKVGQWAQGTSLEGLAFDDYVLGRPKVDRVILHFNYDPNTSLANLLAGTIDVIPSGLTAQE